MSDDYLNKCVSCEYFSMGACGYHRPHAHLNNTFLNLTLPDYYRIHMIEDPYEEVCGHYKITSIFEENSPIRGILLSTILKTLANAKCFFCCHFRSWIPFIMNVYCNYCKDSCFNGLECSFFLPNAEWKDLYYKGKIAPSIATSSDLKLVL